MTEENNQASGAAEEQAAQQGKYALHKVYLKDCSFECPNSPATFQIFGGEWKPRFEVQLNSAATELSPDTREVVLAVTVDAKVVHPEQGEKTAFLAELQQAGIFTLQADFTAEEQKRFLAIECPSVLYPYARETVSELIAKGGFPQFLLQPVNFEALFSQLGEEGAAAGTGGSEAAES